MKSSWQPINPPTISRKLKMIHHGFSSMHQRGLSRFSNERICIISFLDWKNYFPDRWEALMAYILGPRMEINGLEDGILGL
jgi:hypothetical protein